VQKVESAHSWECLVVDNASTDDTSAVISVASRENKNIRGIHNTRIGLGASRDKGWREARGALIAFTDDDCYVTPNYVDAIVSAFEEHPEVGCIGGRILLYDADDAPVTIDLREQAVEIPARIFVPAGTLHGANLSFRRCTLEKIGGIDPQLGAGTAFPCEDIDALAATLWAGFPARFDPRIVVSHHHRRRERDVAALRAAYDCGHGAYYTKYLLRRDTRWAFLKGWIRVTPWRSNPERVAREFDAAKRYLVLRNKRLLATLLTPISLLAVAASHILCRHPRFARWARNLVAPYVDASGSVNTRADV
jgi:hypothetical protein